MQAVVLALIAVVGLSTAAVQALGVPGMIKFFPELLSGIAVIYVLFVGSRKRFSNVQPKYWIVFAVLTLTLICGIVANEVAPGPMIGGLRYYFRTIPFFLLPAVFAFTDQQIKTQLLVLLFIGLIQLPFAIYQRWAVFVSGGSSGDTVRGTFEESGALSLFLISSMLLVVGFFLKGKISRTRCIVLSVLLLAPTTINETKISFLLIPLGLFIAVILGSPPNRRLRIAGWTASLILAFGAVAIPVYDYTQINNPYPQAISLDLVTNPKKNYLRAENAGIGAQNYVGRTDALTIPMRYLSADPVQMAFGVGLGNASVSSLGNGFSGRYGPLFTNVTVSDISLFLVERGYLGVGLFFLLLWFVFSDALALARRDSGVHGAIAIGWSAVIVMIAIANFYKVTNAWASTPFLFWYFSGLLAAKRMQLSLASRPPETVVESRSIASSKAFPRLPS